MHILLTQALADRTGLSAGTIRDYCRLGLLVPVRDSSGRRLFTEKDVQRARAIYLTNMARRPVPLGVQLSCEPAKSEIEEGRNVEN